MNGNGEEYLATEGYALMGAAFEVYNTLGPGFIEDVYQEALQIELDERGIPFVSKPKLRVSYKNRFLAKYYEGDLLVFAEILVELKAVRALAPEHEAQLLNELKAISKRIGYLINFGSAPRLQWSRRIL